MYSITAENTLVVVYIYKPKIFVKKYCKIVYILYGIYNSFSFARTNKNLVFVRSKSMFLVRA